MNILSAFTLKSCRNIHVFHVFIKFLIVFIRYICVVSAFFWSFVLVVLF